MGSAPETVTDEGDPRTDRELIIEFVAMVDRGTATRHKYGRVLEEASAFFHRTGTTLLTARRPDVIRFLAYLGSDERVSVNSHGRLVQKSLGPSSRKAALCALRAFYRHCSAMEYLERDPTLAIETPRVPVRRGLTIGKAAIRRFLDAPGRPRCRIQAYLFVYTAARLASVAALRWVDVDFEQGVIHFNAKFDLAYTLPMHPDLRAELMRWRIEQLGIATENQAVALALTNPRTAYVLLTRNGKPVSKTTLGKQLKWRAARAGILVQAQRPDKAGENKSELSPHAIRRSIATVLRKEGRAIEDIADLLNHRDLNVTRTYYAFTDTPEKRRTIEGLNF
jgi:integrase/recombinase XerD